MLSLLEKENVHIKDKEKVKDVVMSFCKGGIKTLQVITDFDMTITRFAYNGEKCPTSYNIIDTSKIISEDCKKKLKELFDFYYPLEVDPKRTIEEKFDLMLAWWNKAHDLLVEQKIKKEEIPQVVKESKVMLRDGYKCFFDTLFNNNIPLFIFSAGIGDVLEEIIRQAGVFHCNVEVVSNYMDFDENGVLQGFKGDVIHTFNKNKGALKNTDHFENIKERTNIILLGDTMGDVSMADGVLHIENILKIGYLNDKVEESRDLYMNGYDVVLEQDETMNFVNTLLQLITEKN
ncbi:7-methylguanosine phosphate-specific 5'-nucleotidase [Protopterus annectens]|uniref:7-methylguanosine phosphate-specific 5'-nucleotidase n=1 Tax=Protopterus annectens TaxID=7888 RepID=UPI001CFC0C22|nr:7-methylguanosine phosphate-specific 5'-nucleotidase [Protopterus annectens]